MHPKPRRPPTVPVALRALLLTLSLAGSAAAYGDDLPPSWQTDAGWQGGDSGGSGSDDAPREAPRRRTSKRQTSRPWYQPRLALGVGMALPELVPVEGYLMFGKYAALRLFYVPPLPFNIRIEMPSDVVASKTDQNIAVANPDVTIRLKATYGPSYGAEAMVFPFAGSFFLSTGVSHRRMRIVGDARSAILICSLTEAAKEPPCPDPEARLKTGTEIVVKADVETEALLMRGAMGWFWHVGSFGYLSLTLGATRPTAIHSRATAQADLDGPSSNDPKYSESLQELKREREGDMQQKALKEMRPVEEKTLPILGLAAGVRF